MKLTVFGSTGRTGGHVLDQGVRRGHQITAFTRRPEALSDQQALAAIVHGDGRNLEVVIQAVTGTDAVIAIIAPNRRKGPHETAEVSRVIVEAMSEANVGRLVITSAYPIVGHKPRLALAVLRSVLRETYADLEAMERIVKGSNLVWTIARLNRLLDTPATGDVTMTSDLFVKPAGVSRADVAGVLLDLVESDNFAKSAVNVSGS